MPIIPVTLSREDFCVVTEGLVDSGATNCLFDARLARELGIPELEQGKKLVFEGVSGDCFTGYLHDVTLEIGGSRFHNVPVAFSREMPDNAVGLLGQRGFFQLFPITFRYALKEIEIMPTR